MIAIVATLVSLLIPSVGSARALSQSAACGARLQQLGVATSMYLDDHRNALPQMRGPQPGGGTAIVGTLFGGKKGRLPLFGVDSIGPERRPLNSYTRQSAVPSDSEDVAFEMEEFRSPVDRGAEELYLPLPEYSRTESIYHLLGTSYVVNDHSLDGESSRTLVPEAGGPMPMVADPSKTWMLGSHTIYNFQQDSDRGERWYSPQRVEANLLFVDTHARIRVPVPDVLCEVENTTPNYTFFPVPERRRN